jgi:hypothetical protein
MPKLNVESWIAVNTRQQLPKHDRISKSLLGVVRP